MNDEKTVLWEVADGVGRVTLNRPDRLNAWNGQFGRDLRAAIDAALTTLAGPMIAAIKADEARYHQVNTVPLVDCSGC